MLNTYTLLKHWAAGKAGEFIDRGDNTYGGKVVVNPSGGLISKGHPLGATGNCIIFSNFHSVILLMLYLLLNMTINKATKFARYLSISSAFHLKEKKCCSTVVYVV